MEHAAVFSPESLHRGQETMPSSRHEIYVRKSEKGNARRASSDAAESKCASWRQKAAGSAARDVAFSSFSCRIDNFPLLESQLHYWFHRHVGIGREKDNTPGAEPSYSYSRVLKGTALAVGTSPTRGITSVERN